MVDIEHWMAEAVEKLRAAFGPRLVFVGLQGSYRRGEATADSDIDILTVLDRLDAGDLGRYRALLLTLPEGDRAGGFTCGRRELLRWPAHEIFAFSKDIRAYHGSLEGLLPAWDEADIRAGVRIEAANLYHATAHHTLSCGAEDRARGLAALVKPVFFLLQGVHYLRTGEFVETKAALAARLPGEEAALVRLAGDRPALRAAAEADPEGLTGRLLALCGGILLEV